MKTVQFKKGMVGYFNGEFRSVSPGDTATLEDAEADRLIASGDAELPGEGGGGESQSIPVDGDGYAIAQWRNVRL